ncbi:MAG TPA: Dabb family protein [Cyclobacteriaceae bacterium]|jgi:hypothetical protein|nr:Dabb family protein [Cyclobacteriaceae bacterium]
MVKFSRRSFIASLSLLTFGITTLFATKKDKPMLAHHVYFWLKNPNSKEDLKKLLDGIKTLEKIETVRGFHVGVPASTEKRDVVDNSYSASELILFDDVKGQDVYQTHPIHLKFVENCSSLWTKVIVYDSMDV